MASWASGLSLCLCRRTTDVSSAKKTGRIDLAFCLQEPDRTHEAKSVGVALQAPSWLDGGHGSGWSALVAA